MKHLKIFTRLIVAAALVIFNYSQAVAQVSCTGDTPFFQVDLSASPDATWLSPSVIRDGLCCDGGENQENCLEIELLLHPDSEGILFAVESGADPGGALYFQVNCEGVPMSSPTNTICLDGAGPHNISYCKVGNNQNTYSITSIPPATTSNDIVSSPSCPDTLSITGVDPATTTWNSISPGNSGDYNSFLSNLDGTDQGVNGIPFEGYTDVLMTPVDDAPAQIMYEVCGASIGGCGEDPFCDTITVSVFNDLTLQINPQNPTICYGDNGVDLIANVTGGITPLTYGWSTDENTQVINVQSAGTYWVEVTDGVGCMVLSDTVEVNEITQEITVDAGNDVTECAVPLPTITLTGTVTGTNTGIWEEGLGVYDPNNVTLEGMRYTPTQAEIDAGFVDIKLSSTNNLGCPGDSDVVRINLPVYNTEIDSVVIDVSCAGGADGAIDLEVVGGNAINSYFWTTNETTQDISGLTSGTYDVQLVDEYDCAQNYSFQITEPDPLTQDITSPVFAGDFNISCFGEADGSIDYTVQGGTPDYDFSWSNGANTEDLNSLTAGTYSVNVTDMNGCTIDTSITLTEPPLLEVSAEVTSDYNGQDISCYNASDAVINSQVTGGVPSYDIVWTNSTNNIIGTGTELTNIPPGEYTVLVEDEAGCTASDVVIVTQPDSLTTDINVLTDFNGMAVNCDNTNDGSIEAVVTGGTQNYAYTWNTNPVSQTATLNNLSVGTYIVVVTDANNCSSSDTVTLDAHPVPTISVGEGDEACEGDPVSFSVSSDLGVNAVWNFENGSSYNGLEQNNVLFPDVGCFDVTVTVTSDEGCSNTQTLENHVCINPLPRADFSQSKVDITTFSPIVQFWNQSNGAVSVEWDFGDGNTSYDFNPYNEFPNDSSGTYQIQLVATSQYGCMDTVTSLVVVEEKLLIYVPNTFTPDNDDYNQIFFPVLTQGFDPFNYELLIFNRWGEILFESHDSNVGWDGTYGGKMVKDGSYVWKINVKDKNGIMQQFKGHVNLIR